MIPILYEAGETTFASNGLGRLTDIIEATVTEERNGIYELDFTYPIDGRHFDDIQLGRIIAVTHDDSGDVQPFDIVSYSKPIDGVVSFHAVHISYRLREYVVEGVYASIYGIQNAFNKIKVTAYPPNMPFNFDTDIVNTTSYFGAAGDGVLHTARQMLGGVEGSILDAFGGEYEFDRFRVFLHNKRGTKRDFTIRYGVNLTEYTDDTDYSDTFNTAIGFWKGQSEDGEDVIIESSPVTVGSTYTGRTVCAAIDLTSKFEAQPTGAQLTEAARSYMVANQTTIPKQTIKVDFIRLQDFEEFEEFEDLLRCELCDRINVVFPRYNMRGEYKIVRTVWNVVAERYKEMELGELSTTLADALGIVNNDRNEKITNFAVAGSLKAGALYIDGDAQIDGGLTLGGHSSPIGAFKSSRLESQLSVQPSTGTAICSITLPAGTWVVVGYAQFHPNATGVRTMNLHITSGSNFRQVAVPAANGYTVLQTTIVVKIAESTTYYLNVWQNSGTSLTMAAGTDGGYTNGIRAVRIA